METISGMVARKGLTARRLLAELEGVGLMVSLLTVDRWLEGVQVPTPPGLVALSKVLGEEMGVVLEACNASVEARKAVA